MRCRCWLIFLAFSIGAVGSSARAAEFSVEFDRWMYPFNGTPGTRATGSTFGVLNSPSFDDRDAQTLLGFDVSARGEMAANEFVASAVVRATIAVDDGILYDPTYDGVATYVDQSDTDAGRPVELFGVATRNGFTGLTVDGDSTDPSLFKEASSFSTVPGTFREVRSVYPTDFAAGQPRDVSNNVDAGFDPAPFALGTTDVVSAGAFVPINTEFSFHLDLLNADVRQYLRDGLATGQLFFAITSLHTATMGGPSTFPAFFLDAGGVSLGPTATLDLEIAALPPGQPGDTDGDGTVDVVDLNNVRNHFGAAGLPDGTLHGDAYPFDGHVDVNDLNQVRNHFGQFGPATVPEPSSVAMLTGSLVGVIVVRTRRRREGQRT